MSAALRALGAALLLAGCGARAEAPAPAEFSWLAPLEVPAGVQLARVAVPGEALARLRSAGQRDLRVFDADGRAVPFAFHRPVPSPGEADLTPSFAAWPLVRTQEPPRGAVGVRIDGAGGRDETVWLQIGGSPAESPPGRVTLPAVVFDTRAEQRPLEALVLQSELPPNTPVRLRAATSADLAHWTPVPLRGSLYRFGGGGPANDTLRLEQPLRLAGRYLRLEWEQPDLKVTALRGRIATAPRPQRPRAELGTPRQVGEGLEWRIDSTSPVVALALEGTRPSTLLPLRVLGRGDPAQGWRQLAQTLVFRLGEGEREQRSPPLDLPPHQRLRWLRLEPLQGHALRPSDLRAWTEFEPLELVFAAGGPAPLRLAAGRADTPAADVAAGLLASAARGPLSELPLATTGAARIEPPRRSAWDRLLPEEPVTREAALWGLLVTGALLLAAVGWALLRQLRRG